MPSSCVAALERLSMYLASAPPRELRLKIDAPLVLFTDGAVEPSPSNPLKLVASIGACLLDPASAEYLYFGASVPEHIVDDWCSKGAKQIITEAELLPILVARVLFKKHFVRRPFLCFIDNEAALAGVVRGTSTNAACARIIEAIVERDLLDGALGWFARVPSASNPADAPSRGDSPCSVPGFPRPARIPLTWAAVPPL